MGAREIYPSLDQITKVRSKKSKGFSGRNRKFKRFFLPKTGDLQKKRSSLKLQGIFRPKSEIQTVFPAKNRCSPKKKGLHPKNVTKSDVSCQSTKNTNLDLDLRSRSPEPVNFFGAQSSLGGGTSSQLGGHGPGMPPGGAGSGWTALFRAFSSHQQPSAYLTKGIPQLDKPLGQTGQTLKAYTVAEGFQQINNFSLVILY